MTINKNSKIKKINRWRRHFRRRQSITRSTRHQWGNKGSVRSTGTIPFQLPTGGRDYPTNHVRATCHVTCLVTVARLLTTPLARPRAGPPALCRAPLLLPTIRRQQRVANATKPLSHDLRCRTRYGWGNTVSAGRCSAVSPGTRPGASRTSVGDCYWYNAEYNVVLHSTLYPPLFGITDSCNHYCSITHFEPQYNTSRATTISV